MTLGTLLHRGRIILLLSLGLGCHDYAAPSRELPQDSIPTPPDSIPPDSIPPDSIPPDSIPPDSIPTDSIPPDSIPPDTLPPPPHRLDIILILTDDQRPVTMAYMPRTMALIGNQGVQFTNAFASTPLCCPSRASILTGLYTHNHGVITNFPPLGGAPAFVDTSTVATWLKKSGYRTGMFGKYLNAYDALRPWPYKPPGWSVWNVFKVPDYQSFTLVDDSVEVNYGPAPSEYSTDLLASRAVQFIANTPDSQPLFLFYAPFAPHPPAIPSVQDDGSFSWLAPWRPPAYNEADVSDKPTWIRNLPLASQSKSDSNDAFVRRSVETLQSVDRAVEQIMLQLEQSGRLEHAVIVFASDNGIAWGEHRYFTKNCVYEECIRVPLMIRAPGVFPRQDNHLVELVDLAPTIADWAQVTPPGSLNGADMVPLLQNPGAAWRTAILLEVLGRVPPPSTEALFSAVRTDRYLYSELRTGERELYDLWTDPDEQVNIASDTTNASLIATLRALLLPLKAQ